MKNLVTIAIAGTLILGFTTIASADTAKGQGVYMNFCASCHASGIAGAPKVGDKADWQKRNTKGTDAIVKNAINGYQGSSGFMPAKGGNAYHLYNVVVSDAPKEDDDDIPF